MTKTKTYSEPEAFWCSYCGAKIWAVVTPQTSPRALICASCIEKGRHKEVKDD